MAFSVEDFHDLLQILEQRPEWRAELRRQVLSDELLELPAIVRQLAERMDQLTDRMDQLTDRMDQLTDRMDQLADRMDQLAEAQVRTEQQLAELLRIVQEQAHRLGRVEDRLGRVERRSLELHYWFHAPAQFGRIARRLRVIETGPLADLLDAAVERGELAATERDALLNADLVLTGRRRADEAEVYLVGEVSAGVGLYDVERAAERAALLEKLGRPVIPVVAGYSLDAEAAQAAHERGVWTELDGVVTAPRA